MMLKKWQDLPENMQCPAVRRYYDVLYRHRAALVFKRLFDIVVSFLMIIVFCWLFLLVGIVIVCDSEGGAFYKQKRITTCGKSFYILKFRTMVSGADKRGALLTTANDSRVTRAGKILRRTRLDEIPQLFNILKGEMTFVGTRPEAERYVKAYTPEMRATLLLPAGVTSETSILYKDEYEILGHEENAEEIYTTRVLPKKMEINLKTLEQFSLFAEVKTLIRTVLAVLGKDYSEEMTPLSNNEKAKKEP